MTFNQSEEVVEDIIVNSDWKWIKQILLNLLSNSLKFTDEGSIHFNCWSLDENLEFNVIDTGLGISLKD